MARRADITEDKILTDYQEALDMAKGQLKPETIVSAATAQAKLVGLLKDRLETTNIDVSAMENISDILAAVAAESGPEAALALSKAFKLEAPVGPPNEELTISDIEPESDSIN